MIAEERRQKLAEIIRRAGYVSLPDLVEQMGVSESTVRRDLDSLHEAGVVKRTHGGAMTADAGPMASEDRPGAGALKSAIGRAMADIVQDGETVLLDGGSTTLEVARCLAGRPVQVVTNSLPIATLLTGGWKTDLVLLGGTIDPRTGVALGPIAQRSMEGLFVHRLIMGVGGLTSRGLFNSNLLLVETEQAMMRCASEVNIVADHTKFGKQSLVLLADWQAVHRLVVDDRVSDEQLGCVGGAVEVVRAATPAASEQ